MSCNDVIHVAVSSEHYITSCTGSVEYKGILGSCALDKESMYRFRIFIILINCINSHITETYMNVFHNLFHMGIA